MRKIYHLATCSTCKRVITSLNNGAGFEFQNIKVDSINEDQLDSLKDIAGSYEALFSRRAMKYRSLGLGDKNLTESDYRQLILDEYTFLKRPVVIIDDQLFIGSSKKVVESAIKAL